MTTVYLDSWGIDVRGIKVFESVFERLDTLSWETKAVVSCVGVGYILVSSIRAHDKRISEAARSEGYEEGYRNGYSDCNEKLELAVKDYNRLLDSMNRNKDI